MASLAAALSDSQRRRSSDPISWYLATIGRIPLLTPSEEIELGNQVQTMMGLMERDDPESYTPKEKKLIRVGRRSKERMMKANLLSLIHI